jgi:hypothetical protein
MSKPSCSPEFFSFEEFVCPAIPGSRAEATAAFRSRLDSMPTAKLLTLIRKGGLSPERLRAVRDAAASRLATRQSEMLQPREIVDAASRT